MTDLQKLTGISCFWTNSIFCFNELLRWVFTLLLYFTKASYMPRLFITIRLLWTFYKSYLLMSIFITIICLRVFWLNGLASFFGVFWCKVLTLVITFFFVHNLKKKEYYNYQNLGIGKKILWATTLLFDFLLFILLLILTNKYILLI